jgi:hypothetical protein
MTEYQFGKLYKLQTQKRLYNKAFDPSYIYHNCQEYPAVIEVLKKNEIIVILGIMQANDWDEYKVISQNGNIGWIDNINEEYCGFIKEVKPLQKKNK